MKLGDFDFDLPKRLIAQSQLKPRDHSRLLVLDKNTGRIDDRRFYDLVDYLHEGDVLVMNNSKVFPARLIGQRKNTGGRVEVFLHKFIRDRQWECLIGARRIKEGLEVEFDGKLKAAVKKDNQDGTWVVEFDRDRGRLMKVAERIGHIPLPPYIKRGQKKKEDKINYQTVYADKHKVGSVAAPTAGFHFTPRILKKIKKMGVDIEYVTLHVGLGTFAPVKTGNIKKHKMHAEYYEIDPDVYEKIFKAKKEGRRVIAVGTTSARTLESIVLTKKISGSTDIFIYPGYKFKTVDAMITNFHLPKSTLLMLVSAFAGYNNIKKSYQHAIEKKYRFYSYGDSMLIV